MQSSRLAVLRSRLAFLGNPMPRLALRDAAVYLRHNPGLLLTAARNAAGFRITVPLEALRWLIDHLPRGKRSPKDVVLGAADGAVSLAASSELMGNAFRAAADVTVEEVRAGIDELVITIRVAHLSLKALGAQDSPMANLFKSMDMSNPAALLMMMPQKSPAIVEAKKDRFVLDLLKLPKIAANPVVRRALEVLSPMLSIVDVRTEGDLLVIGLRGRPGGLSAALAALRK